jgi:hypothetical protein
VLQTPDNIYRSPASSPVSFDAIPEEIVGPSAESPLSVPDSPVMPTPRRSPRKSTKTSLFSNSKPTTSPSNNISTPPSASKKRKVNYSFNLHIFYKLIKLQSVFEKEHKI